MFFPSITTLSLSAGEELIAACAHNMEDQVYYLIKVRMSDVNFRSLPTGQTPIMFCSNPRIAEILLKEGAGKLFQSLTMLLLFSIRSKRSKSHGEHSTSFRRGGQQSGHGGDVAKVWSSPTTQECLFSGDNALPDQHQSRRGKRNSSSASSTNGYDHLAAVRMVVFNV